MTLTWAALTKNVDQHDAFLQISAFIKSIDSESFSYAEISQVMLAGAFTVVDYDDPCDTVMNFNCKDDRARQIRLSNFMDYATEFTQRRLAQRFEEDRYMARATRDFATTRDQALVKVIGDDFEELISASDELGMELLSQGHKRLALAKAYLDAAFFTAMKDGEGYYREFSNQVIDSLDPKAKKLHKQFSGDKSAVEALHFSMHAGSSTIH